MPRFPVAFGKRKSTADTLENVSVAEHSFRVLDRSEVAGGKPIDGGATLGVRSQTLPHQMMSDTASISGDNIFADLKTNRYVVLPSVPGPHCRVESAAEQSARRPPTRIRRESASVHPSSTLTVASGSGSGSSNTTKTASTDNSSRHSNASTAPSSADMGGQEEWRLAHKKPYADIPVPPIPKSGSTGFLKSSGRSWSFGGQKKHLPPIPVAEEPMPETIPPPPPPPDHDRFAGGRARATTTSTTSTATPPKLEEDFQMDMGGDFGRMLLGFDKRTSVMTVRDDPAGRQMPAPRSLTTGRSNQPSPLHIDRTSKIESSPYSWSSQHSNEQLLSLSPSPTHDRAPAVPRHASPLAGRPHIAGADSTSKRTNPQHSASGYAGVEDEDSVLLSDSLLTVNKFLNGSSGTNTQQTGRYRRNEDSLGSYRQVSASSRTDRKGDDDNLFDTSLAQSSRLAHRYVSRKPSPPRNKVMTPAQFERYRQDKERQDAKEEVAEPEKEPADEEDNYEDDDDEVEKSRQAAKLRRKQEAHMTVYRQQMMKVTGESNGAGPSRPNIQMSYSTPNLAHLTGPASTPSPNGGSDGSDEDEEVPLAILAAHGFPGKNRPPARLSTMMSNPNLRATAGTPSYQRPGSVVGDAAPAAGSGGRLPVFARNLPQDPYLGAGLVNSAVRESMTFGGGSPASGPTTGQLPPGGLVGVIANEERSRAMRRGSPAVDASRPLPNMNINMGGNQQVDPVAGIPHQMMYPSMPNHGMLTPGDQAQIHMTQQMQQFMQMQMQFMQMQMMANGGNGGGRPLSQMPTHLSPMGAGMGMGMGMMGMANPEAMRHSFIDNGSTMDFTLPRPDMHTRSMSMVQPSSASWIQPAGSPGYAPSIRVQGANGYAPSIAPSERSNVGLPGRYRPVSQALAPMPGLGNLPRSSTMSGALGGWDQTRKQTNRSPLQNRGANSDDDDEEGWEAMKAKREKKKSLWKSKKLGGLGAFIS